MLSQTSVEEHKHRCRHKHQWWNTEILSQTSVVNHRDSVTNISGQIQIEMLSHASHLITHQHHHHLPLSVYEQISSTNTDNWPSPCHKSYLTNSPHVPHILRHSWSSLISGPNISQPSRRVGLARVGTRASEMAAWSDARKRSGAYCLPNCGPDLRYQARERFFSLKSAGKVSVSDRYRQFVCCQTCLSTFAMFRAVRCENN